MTAPRVLVLDHLDSFVFILAEQFARIGAELRILRSDLSLAQLREHFSDVQILELGSALAVASGWQRFIEAFGIRPDHWVEGSPVPEIAD